MLQNVHDFSSYLKGRIERENNIPVIVLDADQVDPRDYVESVIKSRLDAYMEILRSRKQAGDSQI